MEGKSGWKRSCRPSSPTCARDPSCGPEMPLKLPEPKFPRDRVAPDARFELRLLRSANRLARAVVCDSIFSDSSQMEVDSGVRNSEYPNHSTRGRASSGNAAEACAWLDSTPANPDSCCGASLHHHQQLEFLDRRLCQADNGRCLFACRSHSTQHQGLGCGGKS